MRGNQRTSGELSRREGGKIFGSGSRTPIAITLLVKNPSSAGTAKIYYHDIGDYLSREEKLGKIKGFSSILSSQMQLSSITPNEEHDWLNQRDGLLDTFIPLEPDKKFNTGSSSVFVLNSMGLGSSRDAWVYNSSLEVLKTNMKRTIDFYNEQANLWQAANREEYESVSDFISTDPTKISWSSSLIPLITKCIPIHFQPEKIVTAMYRPFFKQNAYIGEKMIHRRGQYDNIFPTPQTKNLVICVPGIGAKKGFSALMVDCIPDVQLQYNGQCFPRYYYEKIDCAELSLFDSGSSEYILHDTISDFALERSREMYGPKVTKDDIFYYIYGLLHSEAYCHRFEADLTKMLPRIPLVEDVKVFKAYCTIGKRLADLHVNYEKAEPWKTLIIVGDIKLTKVEKMRFAKVNGEDDRRTIILNSQLRVENIPLQAYEYTINGKSALEWIMERYSITTHTESQIRNDPNTWGHEHDNPLYILDLMQRIITVSIETLNLVAKLPTLHFPEI